MALLGVILLLAGIGAGAFAYIGTHAATGTTTVTAFGFSRSATPLELVAYGAVAVLLFALGWALLSASARRRARLRRDERDSARVAELEDRLESERLEHERKLEEAGLREDDLRRREQQVAARHEGLDQREAELNSRAADGGGAPTAPGEPRRPDEAGPYAGVPWDDERRGSTSTDSTHPDYSRGDATSPVSGDEPPARPAETRSRAHDAPHPTA